MDADVVTSQPLWAERAAVAGGGLALLLAFLWSGSLVNSDDAIYADMARSLASSGDWIDLRWHGAVLHEKPPMLFWLTALSGSLFGFSDGAVRLPGALCALGALLAVHSIAGRLGLDRRARLVAVALTLASGCFYFTARRVMTDAPLLFFGLLSLDAWLAARDRPRRLLLWGAALGAAVLTKWVAAGPYALLALADGALRWRDRSPLRNPWLVAGLGAALVVAAPWHIAQTVRHGSAFWEVYSGYHVVARAATSLVTPTSPGFYAAGAWLRESVLLVPWLAGVSALVVSLVTSRARDRQAWWLALWLALTLIPIHAAQTRLYHYLLPAIPLLGLLGARALAPWLRHRAVLGAVAALAAFAFVWNNGADLTRPDYAPGTSALAPALRALPPDAELLVLDAYDVAATWYAARPVPIWTAFPELERQIAVDMMRRANAVRLHSREDMVRRLRAAPSAAILTVPPRAEAAAALLRAAGHDFETRTAADRVLLVTRDGR